MRVENLECIKEKGILRVVFLDPSVPHANYFQRGINDISLASWVTVQRTDHTTAGVVKQSLTRTETLSNVISTIFKVQKER